MKTHSIGVNVIAAMVLQDTLRLDFYSSLQKAQEYILLGDAWYVCDIIGERVPGYALLKYPEETLPLLEKMSKDQKVWIVRSVVVAGHYAVKKGLDKIYSERLFQILLRCSEAKDFHVKKGIGWAAKTVAKFHPDIITKYQNQIDSDDTKQWFRTKVKIGLSRSMKYAGRHTS